MKIARRGSPSLQLARLTVDGRLKIFKGKVKCYTLTKADTVSYIVAGTNLDYVDKELTCCATAR